MPQKRDHHTLTAPVALIEEVEATLKALEGLGSPVTW